MSYKITLPIGMSTSDIDIPDSSSIGAMDIATREVEITDIDVYKIRDVLQEASAYELKELCISTNINKWAAFKPTKWFGEGGFGTVPSGLKFNEINGGGPWQTSPIVYEVPDTVYVQEHFAGYNHDAVAPKIEGWSINGWEIPTNDTFGLLQRNIPAEPVQPGGFGYTISVTGRVTLGELPWTDLERPDTSKITVTHLVISCSFQAQTRYGFINIDNLGTGTNNVSVVLDRDESGNQKNFSVPVAINGDMQLNAWFANLPDGQNATDYTNYQARFRMPSPIQVSMAGRLRFRYVMADANMRFLYDSTHTTFEDVNSIPAFNYFSTLPSPFDQYQGLAGVRIHPNDGMSGRVIGVTIIIDPSRTLSINDLLVVEVCNTTDFSTYGSDLENAQWTTVGQNPITLSTGVQTLEYSFSQISEFLTSASSTNILNIDNINGNWVDLFNLQYMSIRFRITQI